MTKQMLATVFEKEKGDQNPGGYGLNSHPGQNMLGFVFFMGLQVSVR